MKEEDEMNGEMKVSDYIAKDGQLVAYKHYGFWKPMDTLRDKRELEELWNSGKPPWGYGLNESTY